MSDTNSGSLNVINIRPTNVGTNHDETVSTSGELFRKAAAAWIIPEVPRDLIDEDVYLDDRLLLQTSFAGLSDDDRIAPHPRGLVETIIRAYQQDLHLILRPDDIWLAILIQFSFYLNSEQQPEAREERRTLELNICPAVLGTHMGTQEIAGNFASLIQDQITDGGFSWIIPDFSTTTSHDITIACIAMLATAKHYFLYECHGGCGFPSVTLMGGQGDWEKILKRIGRIENFGSECIIQWAKALRVVVTGFVKSFDSVDSQATTDFWMRAVHSTGRSIPSTLTTISGWLVVFCFWNNQGEAICNYTDDGSALLLNHVVFPAVQVEDLPLGVMEAQMVYKDYSRSVETIISLIASHVGATVSTMVEDDDDAAGKYNTYQPRSGWWVVQDDIKRM
ncbi:hypothetical protein F5X99DRAFT_426808 [Biscogniauxia marginata]|nr:hypothetical protein F5X99DRAFT_426808 [Biscogniauxia marginata]